MNEGHKRKEKLVTGSRKVPKKHGYFLNRRTNFSDRFDNVEADLAELKTEIAILKEKLNHMPTTLQMFVGALLLVLGIVGATWWQIISTQTDYREAAKAIAEEINKAK